MTWQPIETAPGGPVDLWVVQQNRQFRAIDCHRRNFTKFDGWAASDGSYVAGGLSGFPQATHWMYSPEPPK